MRGSVAREMLRDSREIPVLDLRSSPRPRLNGAVEIPPAELPGRVGELSRFRATPVVVVGDDGAAARTACEVLAAEGFKYVVFVPEGAEALFAGLREGASGARPAEERR